MPATTDRRPDTIAATLRAAAKRLNASDTPELDAEVLLAHVLGKPRSHLHAWPEKTLTAEQRAGFEALLARRASGHPVAHLTGRREFWSLELAVTAHTLIPRPDTEQLVERALRVLDAGRPLRVLDAGTGSGAIALALARERAHWKILANDRSPDCLDVARDNARRLRLCNVSFFAGHWCDAVADDSLDALVSNPPYIAERDPHLDQGDVRFEPRTALISGPDGLDDLRCLTAAAPRVLRPAGILLLEHGFDQAEAVARLLKEQGFLDIRQHRDLAGHIRISEGRKPG